MQIVDEVPSEISVVTTNADADGECTTIDEVPSEISVVTTNADADGEWTIVDEVKDDRIAVLEHELRVARDSLEEAETQLKHQTCIASLTSPPPSVSGPADEGEDLILTQLIAKYLKTRGLKLSWVAFNNEANASKQTDRTRLPEDVDLVHLLRSFSKLNSDEPDQLRAENGRLKATIQQLTDELEAAKQQPSEYGGRNDPPSVQLLDALFNDMMQLMNVIDPSERRRMLQPLQTIVKYHPAQETRMQSISLMLNLWDDPEEERRPILVQSLIECYSDSARIESEVLPVLSQVLDSQSPGLLCLLGLAVATLAPLVSIHMRSSLLLSIIRQLAENPNPTVRVAAATNGAALIQSFVIDPESNDKLHVLLKLCRLSVFDDDARVQEAAQNHLVPVVEKFAHTRHAAGRGFCDFWLEQALSGDTQHSRGRFVLSTRILESAVKSLIPNPPKPTQQLVPSGAIPAPELVIIPKTEFEWILASFVPQIAKFAPMYFSPLNIRKEVDRYLATVCRALGQQFVAEHVVPELLTAIDRAEGDSKGMIVTLLLSAVAPSCDADTFFSQSRNFLHYATNELRGFRSNDIQDFFALAYNLLSSREPDKRTLLFKLIEELAKSTRAAIRTSAVNVLAEIVPTLEQIEIEKTVIPIVSKLAVDLDESLVVEVTNCVGTIARLASSIEILKEIKGIFDEWLKRRLPIRMQVLRVFNGIVEDVDHGFRENFILPKLFECASGIDSWSDQTSAEQALVLVLHVIHGCQNIGRQTVKTVVLPTLRIIREHQACAQDPQMEEVGARFQVDNDDSSTS
jgi:hypothetical protein